MKPLRAYVGWMISSIFLRKGGCEQPPYGVVYFSCLLFFCPMHPLSANEIADLASPCVEPLFSLAEIEERLKAESWENARVSPELSNLVAWLNAPTMLEQGDADDWEQAVIKAGFLVDYLDEERRSSNSLEGLFVRNTSGGTDLLHFGATLPRENAIEIRCSFALTSSSTKPFGTVTGFEDQDFKRINRKSGHDAFGQWSHHGWFVNRTKLEAKIGKSSQIASVVDASMLSYRFEGQSQ